MKESNSINDMIRKKLEMNETLKKCQSLINIQRLMIMKEYNIRNKNLLEKYYLNGDMTNKQSDDVINNRIKNNIFNLNNYEQNIKKEAWQKDLNKIYLGLNDENKGKSDNAFFDYNYNSRNKKKEGLIFIKNFFVKMKSAKKTKNLYKKRNTIIKTYQKNNIYDNNIKILNNNKKKELEELKQKKENEINKIWNKIKIKYNTSFKDINEQELHKNNINFFTEINNIKKKKLFPEIVISNSTKAIFNKNPKNKYIYRNKTYNEKLKNIYESKNKNKNKYRTLNSESNKNILNNFEMPELLQDKQINFFKKNNKIFLSPLHFSKYVQMKAIKNSLIKEGFLDKDVFKSCTNNI